MTAVTASMGLYGVHGERRVGRLALNTYDQALRSISFIREAETKFEHLRGCYALAAATQANATGEVGQPFDQVAVAAFDDIADELDSVTEIAAPGPARTATSALRRRIVAMEERAHDIEGSVARLDDAAAAFKAVIEQFSQESFDYRMNEEALIASAIHWDWVAFGSAILASCVITIGLSRAIVPGLRRAILAASAMAEGHLDQAIPPGRGNANETAILLRALSRMQSAINQQLAHIEALHAEAEATQTTVVNGLAEGLQRLAMGDLTFRLHDDFAADYEQIRTDFNDAANQLQQMIRSIALNSVAINVGTLQIARGADDLNQRSERQASSLVETRVAMDGIAARVRQTADGAQHASLVVSQTKADAEQSEIVVGRAALAMAAIEKSSQQITQITGVINDLAFQTRLLALNAGIEAARAGTAGRSFAVVANEVRALAQRSAQAATQIKALISASNDRVGEGVVMVAEATVALRRIMAQVGEINTVVVQIAAANRGEAVSLQEIHGSILMMDEVTHENAAIVEESTAASHALARETSELLAQTSRFRVDAAGATGQAGMSAEDIDGNLELFD